MSVMDIRQMVKRKINILWLFLAGLYLSLCTLSAQSEKTGWESYEYVYGSNPWLQSSNAAGLQSLTIPDISTAETFFNKKNGKLVNYYESDNSLAYGAEARSLYRLNPKVVFFGEVRYTGFEGKNMGGSAFIDPYKNPFDLVEYADSTRGEKRREFYNLVGAFSAEVYKGIIFGAKLDYAAANYAKRRDLRHENKEMDLTAAAGVASRLTPFLSAGVNYSYRRRTEEIRFDMYGNTDQQFNTLIDFGAFYGQQERFSDNDGYTKGNAKTPLFEEFHGVSLQLDFTITPEWSFYNELGMQGRDGYYGKRGTTSIVYDEHDSKILEYRGNLSFRKQNALHAFSLNLRREQLANYENSYRKETQASGNTIIKYIGQTQMLDQTLWNIKGEYTAYLGIEEENPRWVLNAFAGYQERKQTVSLYPNYRKQDIHQIHLDVSASRNLIRGNNQYSCFLGIGYLSGGGNEKQDGKYDSSQSQTSPASLDRYLYREYEYWTTDRVRGDVGFCYSRLLRDRMKGYARLDYALTEAFSTDYIGKTFNELTLTIGVGF